MKLTTDKFTIEWSIEEIEVFIKTFTPYSLKNELKIWKIEREISLKEMWEIIDKNL